VIKKKVNNVDLSDNSGQSEGEARQKIKELEEQRERS